MSDDIVSAIRDAASDIYDSIDKLAACIPGEKRGRYDEILDLDPVYDILKRHVEYDTHGLYKRREVRVTFLRSTILADDEPPQREDPNSQELVIYVRRAQFDLLCETNKREMYHFFANKKQQMLFSRKEIEWMRVDDATWESPIGKSMLLLKLLVSVVGPPDYSFGPHECHAATLYVAGLCHHDQCDKDIGRKCEKCAARIACQHHVKLVAKRTDLDVCPDCVVE